MSYFFHLYAGLIKEVLDKIDPGAQGCQVKGTVRGEVDAVSNRGKVVFPVSRVFHDGIDGPSGIFKESQFISYLLGLGKTESRFFNAENDTVDVSVFSGLSEAGNNFSKGDFPF